MKGKKNTIEMKGMRDANVSWNLEDRKKSKEKHQ